MKPYFRGDVAQIPLFTSLLLQVLSNLNDQVNIWIHAED